jgi:hypothetical protein
MMVRVVMFSAIFLAAASVLAAAETRDDGGAIGHWTRCQFVPGVDAECLHTCRTNVHSQQHPALFGVVAGGICAGPTVETISIFAP